MMFSMSYRPMMSQDASACQAEAGSSCASCASNNSIALILDAIIMASIIICALVCLVGVLLVNGSLLSLLLLVLARVSIPRMRKRV